MAEHISGWTIAFEEFIFLFLSWLALISDRKFGLESAGLME